LERRDLSAQPRLLVLWLVSARSPEIQESLRGCRCRPRDLRRAADPTRATGGCSLEPHAQQPANSGLVGGWFLGCNVVWQCLTEPLVDSTLHAVHNLAGQVPLRQPDIDLGPNP